MVSVIEILMIVDLFLWFLLLVPVQATEQYRPGRAWLVWIFCLLVALHMFVPGLR